MQPRRSGVHDRHELTHATPGGTRALSADRHGLPRPRCHGLSRSHRRGRRAGPAGRVVGRDHVRRAGPPRPRAGRVARRDGCAGRRPGRGRVAELRPVADVVLRRLGLGPGAGADQLPARGRRDPLHRRALRRRGADGRPRPAAPGRRGRVQADVRARRGRRQDLGIDRRAAAVGGRRGRDRDDQLHVRHDRATQGRPADAPQQLAQRDGLRLAGVGVGPRRLPPHAADVPRQRLGSPVRGDRHGRQARRAAPGRRHRDPQAHRAARRHLPVRRARGRHRRPRRREDVGRRDPRPRPRTHHRRGRTAADPHDRARTRGAGLGVHPDLRAHRDRSAADDVPYARGVGRPRPAPAGPQPGPCRRAGRSACA